MLIKNSIFNVLIVISGPFFNLISIPIITKSLGVHSFGEASITLSFISYFTIITTLGLAVYGTRELALVKLNSEKFRIVFSELLVLSIAGSMIGAAVYIALAYIFLSIPPYLILISAISLALNFLNIEWLYYSKENYKIVAYSTFMSRIIGLMLIYIYVENPADANIFIIIQLFINLFPAFLIFTQQRKYVKIILTDLKFSKHLTAIGSFFIIRIFTSIYSILDILIVGIFASVSVAGFYTLAIRVARIITSVVCSITAVAMPRVSALQVNKDKNILNELLTNTLIVTIVISALTSCCTLLFTNEIIFYLGGYDFESSNTALAILSFLTPVVSMSNFIAMQILYPNKREKSVAISIGIGSLSYLIIAPILLITSQINGAAVAIIIAEFIVLGIQIIIAKEYILNMYIHSMKRINKISIITAIFYMSSLMVYSNMKWNGIIDKIITILILCLIYLIGMKIIKEPIIDSAINRLKL
jgi:O-antigen/teichoic acid export membrane protein